MNNEKDSMKKTTKKPVKKVTRKVVGSAPANIIEVVLGPYGTRVEAEQEALQFQHPNVFSYRSAIFPVPANFRVVPVVKVTKVVPVVDNKLYPYGLALTILVGGAPDKVAGWILAFRNRARQMIIGSKM